MSDNKETKQAPAVEAMKDMRITQAVAAMREMLWALTERQRGNVVRTEDAAIDAAKAFLGSNYQMAASQFSQSVPSPKPAVEAGARDERADAPLSLIPHLVACESEAVSTALLDKCDAIAAWRAEASKYRTVQPGDYTAFCDGYEAGIAALLSARAALARASEAAAGEPVDYDRVVQICEAHGIGLPVDCVEMVVEIIRLAAPQAAGAPIYEVIRGDARENCWITVEVGVYNATPAYRRRIVYAAPQPASEQQPEFTDSARAALLWVLYHHQGGSSPIGQPIRFALGMGAHEPLSPTEVADALRIAEKCRFSYAREVPRPASEQQAAREISDAAILACAFMINGICLTRPQDTWLKAIEARIRHMLAAKGDGHAG